MASNHTCEDGPEIGGRMTRTHMTSRMSTTRSEIATVHDEAADTGTLAVQGPERYRCSYSYFGEPPCTRLDGLRGRPHRFTGTRIEDTVASVRIAPAGVQRSTRRGVQMFRDKNRNATHP